VPYWRDFGEEAQVVAALGGMCALGAGQVRHAPDRGGLDYRRALGG
jgi:hypothetical protein